jgi:hypothetical protein
VAQTAKGEARIGIARIMMATIFSKLNLKQQSEILVVHAPASFEAEVARLTNVTVRRSVEEMPAIEFVLAFVTQQEEVNQLTQAITVKTKGDALVWFAYPKGASKKYKCDFNRDTGWAELGKAGFEPVRMVAIDEDWSALRFRRVEYIKTLTRNKLGAISEQGKARMTKN